MADLFRTIVVPTESVELARKLSALIYGGDGMYTTGLALDEFAPATHYVSSGYLPESYVYPLPLKSWQQTEDGWNLISEIPGNPEAVLQAATDAGITVTLQEIENLFASSDISEQNPWSVFNRLGLKMVAS